MKRISIVPGQQPATLVAEFVARSLSAASQYPTSTTDAGKWVRRDPFTDIQRVNSHNLRIYKGSERCNKLVKSEDI
jgi:hypothetical protein